MAAFSSAGQVRRRPAPVNTSTRRARSDTCISSEIDICRSSKPAPNIIPFTPGAGRCSPDDAYGSGGSASKQNLFMRRANKIGIRESEPSYTARACADIESCEDFFPWLYDYLAKVDVRNYN